MVSFFNRGGGQGVIPRDSARVRLAKGFASDIRMARRSRDNGRSMQEVYGNLALAARDRDVQDNFSLRESFIHTIEEGHQVLAMFADQQGFKQYAQLREAGYVRSDDFSDFTFAVLSQRVKDAFDTPQYIGASMVTTIPSRLRTERIPGISNIGDAAAEIGEGDPYPSAGLGNDYVDTPYTKKRGLKIGVTREAVFFDRTGLVLMRCDQVGDSLALRKEKLILAVVCGADNTKYKPKDSQYSTNTYQTGAGGDAFNNTKTSNGFTDWTSLSAARLAFRLLKDPRTGEAIVLGGDRMIWGSDALTDTVLRTLTAEQIRTKTNGGNTETISNNPAANAGQWKTNELVAGVVGNDTNWFYGSPKKAFGYVQNWDIETLQAPPNSYAEWEKDIVAEYKSSEMGTPVVLEPRFVMKNTP